MDTQTLQIIYIAGTLITLTVAVTLIAAQLKLFEIHKELRKLNQNFGAYAQYEYPTGEPMNIPAQVRSSAEQVGLEILKAEISKFDGTISFEVLNCGTKLCQGLTLLAERREKGYRMGRLKETYKELLPGDTWTVQVTNKSDRSDGWILTALTARPCLSAR